MTLDLDARQRAMLLEMGITVWLPGPPPTVTTAACAPAAAREVAPAHAAPVARTPVPPAAPAPAPVPAPVPVPVPHGAARPVPAAHAAPRPAYSPDTARGWRVHPARPVYAPPAGSEADAGWLILLEQPVASGLPVYPPPSEPAAAPSSLDTALEGDAARLLDNMLRALRLHRHPRVWSAALERTAASADGPRSTAAPLLAEDLHAMVRTLQPARVLVLGLAAARAVLGRNEPLGRLRAESHELDGRPVVVTYDPNYLLRAPQAKAAAWADLCRAQTLGRPH